MPIGNIEGRKGWTNGRPRMPEYHWAPNACLATATNLYMSGGKTEADGKLLTKRQKTGNRWAKV
jgi:hypothetical protein